MKEFFNAFDMPYNYNGNEKEFWSEIVKSKTFYILDYGKRQWYLWNSKDHYHPEKSGVDQFSDAEVFPLNTPEDLQRLIDTVDNNILVTEHAHWKPRTKKSKSQPLLGEELLFLNNGIRNNGGFVLIGAQDMTANYLTFFRHTFGGVPTTKKQREDLEKEFPKTDTKDPYYLYHAVLNHPEILSSFNLPPTEEADCEISEKDSQLSITKATKAFYASEEAANGLVWRTKVNANLNLSRMNDYSIQSPEDDPNTTFLLENFEEIKSRLKLESQKVLGFVFSDEHHIEKAESKKNLETHPVYIVYKNNEDKRRNEWNSYFHNVSVLSVLGSIRSSFDGKWMVIQNGDKITMPSNNFMKRHVFGFRPKRKGSGVCRSNVTYWSATKVFSDYCKNRGTPTKSGHTKLNTYTLDAQTRTNFKDIRKQYKLAIMDLYSVLKSMALEDIKNGGDYINGLDED